MIIIIKNFDEEIKKAKEETIKENILAWKQEWAKKHKKNYYGDAPEPPKEEVTPRNWFITEWGTGFIVADIEKLQKLPKRTRDKIYALGGIYNG